MGRTCHVCKAIWIALLMMTGVPACVGPTSDLPSMSTGADGEYQDRKADAGAGGASDDAERPEADGSADGAQDQDANDSTEGDAGMADAGTPDAGEG